MAQKCGGGQPAESRVGLSAGGFRTRLSLGAHGQADFEEAAVGGSFERRLSKRLTLEVNGGGLVFARLGGEAGERMRGAFLGLGLSWAALEQQGAVPFVMLGLSLAASLATSPRGGEDALYAADVRASVTAGYTLAQRLTPYAVVRVFGGPVVLVDRGETFLGTDLYHFQLGAGLMVGLPEGFDLSVELIPLGEQRLSAGLGYSF